MRAVAFLVLLLASLPAQARGHGKAPAATEQRKEPLEFWLEAEDKMAAANPAQALDALRQAIAEIQRRPAASKIAGPAGALWTKAEALYRYTMRAGDVAMLVSWREAAPLFESAVKLAVDKATRSDAELKLDAARANLAAGADKAPSFLGDDLGGADSDPTTGSP